MLGTSLQIRVLCLIPISLGRVRVKDFDGHIYDREGGEEVVKRVRGAGLWV
jgi:hypothetical protein